MKAKCKKCGNTVIFNPIDVNNEISDVIQLDIFGNGHNVVYGWITCNHCGSVIYTEKKEDLIRREKIY